MLQTLQNQTKACPMPSSACDAAVSIAPRRRVLLPGTGREAHHQPHHPAAPITIIRLPIIIYSCRYLYANQWWLIVHCFLLRPISRRLGVFFCASFGNVESSGTVLVHEKYSTCGDFDLAGFVRTYSSSFDLVQYSHKENEMLKLESCDWMECKSTPTVC
jgi:hypothetical protein